MDEEEEGVVLKEGATWYHLLQPKLVTPPREGGHTAM